MNIPVICGTTSSGKSSYAFELAKKYFQVNILSVDSRQFYKDIPIVSGQDIAPPNATLYGQGILSADQVGNIADFYRYALPIINESTNKNIPLIVVGGSGLYLKAITSNLSDIQVPPDEVFRQKAENMTVGELQDELKKINSDDFNSLNNSDSNNPRRLIRHIEISNYYKDHLPSTIHHLQSTIQYQWIGLRKSSSQLAKDIQTRVLARLDQGAADEVKELLKKYPNQKLPIYSTLGVKQVTEFIENKIDREKLIKDWTQSEISYAKRQDVWFKKQPGIIWYDNTNHDQK